MATANQYQVLVYDAQNATVVDTWVEASTACSGGTCSATPSTTLTPGSYQWWIRTRNASGDGPWSAAMSFVVGSLPDAATLISPQGDAVSPHPTFTWNVVDSVTQYQVLVYDAQNAAVVDVWVDASTACNGGACQTTPSVTLEPGTHQWWIRTRNASGDGPWSAAMSFIVGVETSSSSAYRWHYQYDGLSRVISACSQWDGTACTGDEFQYAYDGAGNLTRFDKWNASTNTVDTVRYVINGANQIACVDDASADGHCDDGETLYQYDRYGNLLNDGIITYVYDTANRLYSVIDASSTTTYAYNGDGDRVSQSPSTAP